MNDTEKSVFEYMKSQNRPYSAIDVFNNLHKAYGKTAIVKALESLAEKKKLLEKTYGKSKIYVVDQAQFPNVDDAILLELDNKIGAMKKCVDESSAKLSTLSSNLKALNSSLTSEDAAALLKKLKPEVEALEERLSVLKSNTVCIDADQKRKINEKCKSMVGQWKKRKRMTTDLMNAVLEGYPKTKKQFIDEVGIETDEDCQVVVPEI